MIASDRSVWECVKWKPDFRGLACFLVDIRFAAVLNWVVAQFCRSPKPFPLLSRCRGCDRIWQAGL
jgi:hypothetical protein